MRKAALALAGLLLIVVVVAFGSIARPAFSTPKPASFAPLTITPSVVPPWTVTLDANSTGNMDVSGQATNSPAKSFRVGAIIDASSATPVIGVYGWQFGITYDKTTLVTQGDPVAGDASDGAQSTVVFGGQTGTGNPNWALMISGGRAFGSSSVVQVDATHQQIIVFFTVVAPNPAVTIGPSVSGNLLANVAFEIVGEPVDPVVLSITDVQFADLNALSIPNINAGPDITEAISDIPPVANFTVTPLSSGDASCLPVTGSTCSTYAFKFDGSTSSDADGTIANPQGYFWDFGDGTQDNVNVGACAPLTCNQGPVAVQDYGRSGALLPGTFTVTLRVVDSQGDTGSARDSFSGVIVNNQPSHTSQTVLADAPPTARFTSTPASPGHGQTVVFDGTTSTDDGTITIYSWDFGDGAKGTGATASHPYALVGSYLVTLTVTDNVGLTDTISHTIIVTNLLPIVSFTESSSSAFRDQSITLTISANDPDGTVSGIRVDWGDGTVDNFPGTATGDSHAYVTAGTYTVTVTAIDNDGATSTPAQATKTITDAPPTAKFTESTTTATTGTSISFDASDSSDPDGTITSYLWDFGDGNTAAGVTATHIYGTAGPYTVTLTVTDNARQTATATAAKTITDRPPVASFSESATTALTQFPISFDASRSFDPDGTITSYSWNFGDGTSPGDGVNPSHTYGAAGTYTVTLTVMDNHGNTDTTSAAKTITDRPPTVSFTETATTGVTLDSITLTITSSDPDGTVTTTMVDWGDTHVDTLAGTATTDSHSYATAGTYTVTVTVTDDNGSTANSTAEKTITDRPPIASFSESSTTMVTGRNIHFDASGSSDPDGIILDYSWDFGDGSTGTGVTVDHAYSTVSAFTVTLTVKDNSGNTGTATATKTIIRGIFQPAFVESATTTLTLDAVSFDASTSQDNAGTITLYQWDFGDGSPLITGQVIVDHTYVKAGTYTVVLTIADDQGQTGTVSSIKTVQDRPPTAVFSEDKTTALTGEPVGFDGSLSSDVDGTVVTYSWDFGDGSTGSGPAVSHSYAKAGTYTVTLTVTDDNGMTSSQASAKTIIDRAPIVSFEEDKTIALTGVTITLTIASSDVDGTVTGTQVDWGDGTVNNLPGAATSDSHSYSKAGSFTVTVTVTDDAGLTSSSQAAKMISDRPPVAIFIESFTNVLTGVSISFDASTSNDPDGSLVTYSWNFGDGGSETGLVVSHSYAKAGIYVVTLTVTDDNGSSDNTTSTKTIGDRPPVASFSESLTTAPTGTSIVFDASASSDPDGSAAIYAWDFGDSSTGAGGASSHGYAVAGTYTVTLTVTDDSGNTNSVSALKTITDRPPVATFTESSTSVPTGTPVQFDASSSSDADGTIVSFAWNFGDGTMETGQTRSHSYATAGTYTVTLTVTDDSSNSGTATATKTITDRPPVARFSESATQTLTQIAISFDASGSPDIDGTIAIYAWDFGDGSTGSGSAVSHTYARAGLYTVNLTVTDDSGSTGTASAVKSIGDRPPVASFTASSTTIVVGNPLKLNASGSSDQDGTVTSFSWTFGDGSNDTGSSVSHVYNATGTFTIALVVIDDSGSTGSTNQVVSVILPTTVLLTFQAYDAEDFFKDVGALDVRLNGSMVVNIPGGLFQLSGTGHYAPLAKVWADFGPFEITSLVKPGTNSLVFSDPLQSHITPIRNVKVVTGDSTTLLDHPSEEEVGPRETVTLNFSIPPLQVSSFAVSPALVFNTEVRTFTATYEGGVGPFTCTFNFGDGESTVVRSTTQACSAVHTYWLGDENTWWDAGGNFTATVGVVGANTGDSVVGTLPVEVLRQPSFTGNGLTWTRSVTTSVQTFSAQVSNPGHVDLLVRVDFSIYTPSGGTDPFTSPSFLVLDGQTRGDISFNYTPTAHGWYCYQGTLTYGRDLNHDGVLQDSEVLGTKHAEYGCFQVS